MSFEKESRLRVPRSEGRERSLENKEKQTEELEKKMGARERVEQVTHEVKTTQKQMQNIMSNMQQVMKAVAAIRRELQLDETNVSIPSLKQDQKVTEALQKKLAGLKDQLQELRLVLLQEEREQLKREHGHLTEEEIDNMANKKVEEILKRFDLSS